jgi:hypothetical protein
MGLKKLIKSLQTSLSGEYGGEQTSRERIEELLSEFDKKEKKLKHKLSKEEDTGKRKDLKLKLKIIAAQREKGMARLRELEKESL